jgi:hypothetical protein
MFEVTFELVSWFVLEVLGQIVFELLTTLGWESLKSATHREKDASPALAAIGQFLMGCTAGGVSLLLLRRPVFAWTMFRGVSLVVSLLATGLAMHSLGELWRERGRDRPPLFTFKGGAMFAAGMALVRFMFVDATDLIRSS